MLDASLDPLEFLLRLARLTFTSFFAQPCLAPLDFVLPSLCSFPRGLSSFRPRCVSVGPLITACCGALLCDGRLCIRDRPESQRHDNKDCCHNRDTGQHPQH